MTISRPNINCISSAVAGDSKEPRYTRNEEGLGDSHLSILSCDREAVYFCMYLTIFGGGVSGVLLYKLNFISKEIGVSGKGLYQRTSLDTIRQRALQTMNTMYNEPVSIEAVPTPKRTCYLLEL